MIRMRSMIPAWLLISGLFPALLAAQETGAPSSGEQQQSQTEKQDAKPQDKASENDGWKPMLPKKGLKGWEITDFGTSGKVTREGELLILEMGDPLNGITFQGKDFPTDSFEISLEAMRIEGNDFLCGLTFPVGEEFCSFIAGGWGGGVVGLSNIDGYDASENQTTSYYEFENGKWHKFKVRVTPKAITTWIDDKEFFQLEREHHEFSTRIEVYACQPLGLCAFQSKVAVRNFQWRPLPKEDAQQPASKPAASQDPKTP